MELAGLFTFAFLGGVILNIMPCVLPVLALKAFSVLDHARAEPRMQRLHGLAYSIGTISALTIFGAVVALLRSLGNHLGWGMQFQHPLFVAILVAIVFAFALNALGVFELTLGMSTQEHDGLFGSVANGWLAAIMSTPCSAPFLGTAAAFAMAAETKAWQTVLIFALVGAGLAAPFLLLSWVPALARRLPRPGAWMHTIKMIMGFCLLGTAVWLYRVLLKQVTSESAAAYLGFLVLLGAGLWGQQHWGGLNVSTLRRWGVRAASIALVALGASLVSLEPLRTNLADPVAPCTAEVVPPKSNDRIAWIPFTPERVQSAINSGQPVFLDFTAEWCVGCKALEKTLLETETVREAVRRTGVAPIRVDMTQTDDTTDAWLAKTGRSGIPTLAVMTKSGIQVLPDAVTPHDLVAALESASSASRGHP